MDAESSAAYRPWRVRPDRYAAHTLCFFLQIWLLMSLLSAPESTDYLVIFWWVEQLNDI